MRPTRNEEPIYFSAESLSAERPRLVRYCAKFTRSGEAAEDLAQETLITAWETRDRLREYDSYGAYLTGVARNICLRFLRRQSAERRRIVPAEALPEFHTAESLPDTSQPDLDELLERKELERLMERAMAALPRKSHELLLDRYMRDLPVAEIADKRGIREETAAVQLYRSRNALQKTLTAPEFIEESAALGLIDGPGSLCRETNIWCPKCGARRLRGYLGKSLQGKDCQGASCATATEFFLSCPVCDRDGDAFLTMRATPGHPTAPLLENVKGIKPALNRVSRWWDDLVRTAVATGVIPCFNCGHNRPIQTRFPADFYDRPLANRTGLWALCERCGKPCHISAEQMNLVTPEGDAFWRDNPRLLMPLAQERPSANGPIVVTRLESATGSAALEFARAARTMELIEITRH